MMNDKPKFRAGYYRQDRHDVATHRVRPIPEERLMQYEVKKGDTLRDIANNECGDPGLWPLIYSANTDVLGERRRLSLDSIRQLFGLGRIPPALRPGMMLTIPDDLLRLLDMGARFKRGQGFEPEPPKSPLKEAMDQADMEVIRGRTITQKDIDRLAEGRVDAEAIQKNAITADKLIRKPYLVLCSVSEERIEQELNKHANEYDLVQVLFTPGWQKVTLILKRRNPSLPLPTPL